MLAAVAKFNELAILSQETNMFDTSYLLISLVFSSIGLGYFIYGKKQKHNVAYYSGICLMVYPYMVSEPVLMFVIGIALMFAPKFIRL